MSWLIDKLTGPFLRPLVIGQAISMALMAGAIVFLASSRGSLLDWQRHVLGAIAHAVDQRDGRGRLLPVKPKDAPAHILALGRVRADIKVARQTARAEDAAHSLKVERQDAAINRKEVDDLEQRLAAARSEAAALRRAYAARGGTDASVDGAAQRLRTEVGATGGDRRDGGASAMPGLSAARSPVDETAGADRLPEAATTGTVALEPMTIEERLLATEQAIRLDGLISAIEGFAKVDR